MSWHYRFDLWLNKPSHACALWEEVLQWWIRLTGIIGALLVLGAPLWLFIWLGCWVIARG